MKRGRLFASLMLSSLFITGGCGHSRDLDRASSQLHYGVSAARMSLWREALFRFNRAAQIEPSNAMIQNNLAVAYESTGEYEKARRAYIEALRLDRTNQFIQKNYSRFVEFSTKNKKRELQAGDSGAETSSSARPAPSSPPSPGQIPSTGTKEPPQPPVASPPSPTPPPPAGGGR